MEIEVAVAKLEARVDRNSQDISKIIESLTATRDAAIELTANIQQIDHSIKDYSKTLYGNGDRKSSLVTIADTLVIECEDAKRQMTEIKQLAIEALEIAKDAAFVAKTANKAAQASLAASNNFNKLVEGNLIQIGKFKLTGMSANIAAMMIVPITVVAIVGSIIYFILAIIGKVPWPWN